MIEDPVFRLRWFGAERAVELAAADRWLIGAAPECSIRIDDPSGRVSRRHAELRHERERWSVHDLKSTNGLRQNRDDRQVFQLAPGDEIELGGITLIAESRRSIALHHLLRRLLGWSAARLSAVDQAFREVREAAHLRAALFLRGEGALVGAARRLHEITLGDRPFVALGRGDDALAALERAATGTLYVAAPALPAELEDLVAGVRVPAARVRLVVGAGDADPGGGVAALTAMMPRIATVWIPPLGERRGELDQLFEAYGQDAATVFGTADAGLRPTDLIWFRGFGAKTHAELEELAERMVALRNWGVTAGAQRLGITHGALSRWARRRNILT